MPVDLAGVPCEYDALREIAHRHKLVLIADAAHSLPARYKDEMVGTICDMTAFSFYVTKPLATGEGGMLVTNNQQWAERAQVMSLHGMSRDAWKRHTTEGSWYYEVVAPGFKYNMTDVAAALGLRQLTKQERFLRGAASPSPTGTRRRSARCPSLKSRPSRRMCNRRGTCTCCA